MNINMKLTRGIRIGIYSTGIGLVTGTTVAIATLHIEYGAGLTSRQMHCYTTSLVESGFLKRKQTKRFDLRQYYEITDKGRHYMQIFGELENDMKPISDDPLKQNLII